MTTSTRRILVHPFFCFDRDQLPLLCLRTQATCYVPFQTCPANDHTYISFDERYCPSCLPNEIAGSEVHTPIHRPHSPPLSQPAIQSLTCALRTPIHYSHTNLTNNYKYHYTLYAYPTPTYLS